MNNIHQTLFNIYNNIDEFYKYRGLVSLDDKLSQSDMISTIQKQKYLIMKSVDIAHASTKEDLDKVKKYVLGFNEKSKQEDITITYIILSYVNTEVETKRANVMKLINHIRYPKAKTIIITPTKLNSSIQKYIAELPNSKEHSQRSFHSYTYSLLKTVLPKYDLVPDYHILSADEREALSKQYISYDDLPRIFDSDPQMVWIGASVGDIVKYIYPSEITITGVGYCSVVASEL